MGKLTQYIQSYKSGDITLGELGETLETYKYRQVNMDAGRPDNPDDLIDWLDNRVDDDEDTWDEVLGTLFTGLLSDSEYQTLEDAYVSTGSKEVQPFWTGDKWVAYP